MLAQLQQAASKIPEKDRSLAENEIMRIFDNINLYADLSRSFIFAYPQSDFTIISSATKTKLGLSLDQNQFSFIDIALKANEINVKDNTVLTIDIETGASATTTQEISNSKSVVGLRLGAGAEQRFSQNFAVTLDYIYTNYGSVDVSGTSDVNYININCPGDLCVYPDGLNVSDEVKVTRNVWMLGMNYYF